MFRELLIFLYLTTFRIPFTFFKLFPQKKKTVFVASFGDNSLFIAKEVAKQTDDQIVILKDSQCKLDFRQDDPNWTVIEFKVSHLLGWFRSIYHLATSQKVFVDNYFGFLSVARFKKNVQCIQLWHAAGAIKKFGLEDPSIKERTPGTIKRFIKVYDRFNYVAVGSERMATIFQRSFGLSDDRMLRVGIPRTDFFFNSLEKQKADKLLKEEIPVIGKKRVILYAPTFRNDHLVNPEIVLDIQALYKKLSNQYILLLRLHPAVHAAFENDFPGFVFNVSKGYDINHLLVITDILITDYSSIPFEFSLLERPMIFYAYDLQDYRKERGFWEDYEKLVPGPIVENTDEIIELIEHSQFDLKRIQTFAAEWNQYSTGSSSKNMVKSLYKTDKSPARWH
ncbi:CDP-glycerol glycerophosphotransferase family protein [Ornithinibacillus bavariensis]|uniref:CDP-glycerol glycerophosphotransferase family protein n=1 Tax=Ornithinibacillus bavariensis TaxID=545502 RepID=UPI000EB9CE8D|nr:CDP-glycerol--glycerophosphate glycerophosphotransferase [Ornithinibacillus sp.]